MTLLCGAAPQAVRSVGLESATSLELSPHSELTVLGAAVSATLVVGRELDAAAGFVSVADAAVAWVGGVFPPLFPSALVGDDAWFALTTVLHGAGR